jgi:hypothetical protein
MKRGLARVGLALLYPGRLVGSFLPAGSVGRPPARISLHSTPEQTADDPEPRRPAAHGRAVQSDAFAYIESDIPPGMTIDGYRACRAATRRSRPRL